MSDYYEFPGGIQAIDIARHLTGNASHAVCYIARSCRLDGNNKGEVEADLRKAIDFLEDELRRVGGTSETGMSVEEWEAWLADKPNGYGFVDPYGDYWERGLGFWHGAGANLSTRGLAVEIGKTSD